MKRAKFSQALLPLAVWILCLRQQIEMQDFCPHISESNHRYYFPSPQSLTESHKTRILCSNEYTIYIKEVFGFPLNQNLCVCVFVVAFCFVFFCFLLFLFITLHLVLFRHMAQLFLSGMYFICAVLFWIWDLKHFSPRFYLPPLKCTWLLSFVNTEWSHWDVLLFPFFSSLGQTF